MYFQVDCFYIKKIKIPCLLQFVFIHVLFTQFSSFKAKTGAPGKVATVNKNSGTTASIPSSKSPSSTTKSASIKKIDDKKPAAGEDGYFYLSLIVWYSLHSP